MDTDGQIRAVDIRLLAVLEFERLSDQDVMAKDQSFRPGPKDRTVLDESGNAIDVPAGWELLPPGDAGMTRRVKAAGDFWLVAERKGRKTFSRGLWAPRETILNVKKALEAERSTEAYAKKQAASKQRREKIQKSYVDEFRAAVLEFLDFDAQYQALAEELADRVTAHATPVGSGTVARTQRIPVEKRAESAVIAWMRHQTTAYDSMVIPRVKGKRREVRRMLAKHSKVILQNYRRGSVPVDGCPLQAALRDGES